MELDFTLYCYDNPMPEERDEDDAQELAKKYAAINLARAVIADRSLRMLELADREAQAVEEDELKDLFRSRGGD